MSRKPGRPPKDFAFDEDLAGKDPGLFGEDDWKELDDESESDIVEGITMKAWDGSA